MNCGLCVFIRRSALVRCLSSASRDAFGCAVVCIDFPLHFLGSLTSVKNATPQSQGICDNDEKQQPNPRRLMVGFKLFNKPVAMCNLFGKGQRLSGKQDSPPRSSGTCCGARPHSSGVPHQPSLFPGQAQEW